MHHAASQEDEAASAPSDQGVALVMPVKKLALAKTRLAPAAGPRRADLALAFAADTVVAALACPLVRRVLVVSSDERVADRLGALGALVVADEPEAGLNAALVHGAREARRLVPRTAVAALSADLPALRPADLTIALAAALPTGGAPGRAFVPDAAGTGTTLLVAAFPAELDPRFGNGSRAAHLASGAAELALPGIASLRRDVDTEEDLAVAVELGVGRHTAALLGAASRPGLSGLGVGQAQATVSAYAPETGGGAVLLDDGVELPFDRVAVASSRLRLLRPGQRVTIRVEGRPGARRVVLVTIA